MSFGESEWAPSLFDRSVLRCQFIASTISELESEIALIPYMTTILSYLVLVLL